MSDTFRKEYKHIDGVIKDTIFIFKSIAENLEKEFDLVETTEEYKTNKRCLALARTNLEQAIMWAVKAIT
jgi:hypothetical protein